MPAINNVPTTDTYGTPSSGAYIETPGPTPKVVNVQITRAPVYMNVGSQPPGGGIQWSPDDEYLNPGAYSFNVGPGQAHQELDAARFKSASAGVPGNVTVKA